MALADYTNRRTNILAGNTGELADTNMVHDAVNNLVSHALTRKALDPRDYGAAWDGSTDDTVALRSTVTAAISSGRPVLIPAGTGIVGTVDANGYIIPVTQPVSFIGEAGAKSIVKVKAATGDYFAVFGPSGATGNDQSGLSYDNFTIDQNNQNNAATYTGLVTNGKPRMAIAAYMGTSRDVRIHRMRFKNFDNINTVAVNGANADEAWITDNWFYMASNTAAQHDHSSVYVTAKGATITGNRFFGVAGGNGAITAIETHGSNQVVTGNAIRDYYTGLNITGVRPDASTNVIVTGNTMTDVNAGIALWSRTPGTGLRNAIVEDNTITLARDTWVSWSSSAYTRGIIFEPNSSADFDNIAIRNNLVEFKSFSAAALTSELNSSGMDLRVSDGTIKVTNLDVVGNTIIGSLSAGIRIDATLQRARIADNRIVNPGSSTEGAMSSIYKSGITCVGTFTDVAIERNLTFDTRGTHLVVQGVHTSNITATTRCIQGGNLVTCTDGTELPAFVQSSTSTKTFAPRPVIPLSSRFTAGLYYGPEGTRTTVNLTAGTGHAIPFWVSNGASFDRIGAEVTVAGAASTVIRLGIYADNGKGTPGALLLDAGTIAGDAVAAAEITISQNIPPGLWWLFGVAIGGTPTVRAISGNIMGGAGVSTLAVATGATPRAGYTMSGVTSTLPSTFTSVGQTGAPMLVVMRAA